MKSADKNTSVFPQGDLSQTEAQRCKAGTPRSVTATIDRKGWKHVRLGDVCKLCRGVRVVRSQLSQGCYLVYQNSLIPLGHYDKYNAPAKTTFVIAAGSAGEIGYCDESFWAADDCFFLLPNESIISKFLYYSLTTQHQHISGLVRRGSVPRLARDIVGNLVLRLPDLSEQDEIVGALTSIDTHISALESLIAKYEAIKKATVNLLLEPKTGWRRVLLGDVCSSFSYGVGASAIPYDGTNRYIRITDIDDDSHEFRPSPLSSPSHFKHDNIVNEGDILIARTGASVGKSYIYHPNDGKLIFAGFLIRAAINHDVADPYFIFLQTLTDKYRQWVAEESMRSGQPGLNINQYKDFEFCIPKMSEQHKITAQINEIDAVLNDCKKQLNKAQNLKQGMMSYFFG